MADRHTILVVDDEPYVVESVQHLLRLDYRVLGATSGQQGVEVMHREEVHVVMTDQRMPGMTGVEFLHQVRGEYPDAIRIIVTGYADIQAVIDAINQGNVYRYVVKPWDPAELEAIVREACERYELIVERRRLLAEVQAKNQELEQANAELRRADELKYAFVQVASHELRTPLSIVLMLLQLALRVEGVGPEMADYLRRMERACRRLEYLVKQMDTVIAARRFGRSLVRRGTDLKQLLDVAAQSVEPFVALRHQVLALDLPADLGTMPVDAAKIQDSVEHLLLNAVKFTPDRGRIALSARRLAGGAAEIRVSDTGMGIDAQSLPHIFDPLFTGFDTRHHSSGVFEFGRQGLGLGLCTAHTFVKMHGGTLTVQSELGRGATFTITLPGVSAPPDEPQLTVEASGGV
jgi:signal transduction histidine kinase